VWDIQKNTEINNIKFANIPNSIELSRDGQLLILSQGSCVELYDANSYLKLHSFTIPSPVSAASIHPDK
jgi:serine-threonine kinase receptor-associated protein